MLGRVPAGMAYLGPIDMRSDDENDDLGYNYNHPALGLTERQAGLVNRRGRQAKPFQLHCDANDCKMKPQYFPGN